MLQSNLHLLQTAAMIEFWTDPGNFTTGAIIFVAGFIVILVIFIALVASRKRISVLRDDIPQVSNKTLKQYSKFAFQRLAKKYGLNPEQTKMLDYVLRTDNATNPERSINSSKLLDRHFKKAYRVIVEESSNNDEEIQGKLSLLFSTRSVLENSVSVMNMVSTRRIPEKLPVVLNVEDEKYNATLVSASGDTIKVVCKESPDDKIKFPKRLKLNVVVSSGNGNSFSFDTHVYDAVEHKGSITLKLAHSGRIKHLIQRRYRRRELFADCSIFLVHTRGKQLVVDKKAVSGEIMDVSAGGCSLNVKAPIPNGTRIKIEYISGKDNPVAALGQVLRTNISTAGTILNVKFLKIPRKSMNTINAFVYDYAD